MNEKQEPLKVKKKKSKNKQIKKLKTNIQYLEVRLKKGSTHRFLNSLLLATVVYMLITIDQENTNTINTLKNKIKTIEQKNIIYDEELFLDS